MRASLYACVDTLVFRCVRGYMRVWTHLYSGASVCASMRDCVLVCVFAYLYRSYPWLRSQHFVSASVCAGDTYAHIRKYIHTRTHTRTYAYTHALVRSLWRV